jgi:uncharacterized protein YecE (DUF72 family)
VALAGAATGIVLSLQTRASFLRFGARQFRTVEIDCTFYWTPSAKTVESWYEETPADFIFAAKVPQVITHDKALVDCDAE